MSKNGVPSLTEKHRHKTGTRADAILDTYGLEIVVKIGDMMRSKGSVRKGDILTRSESRKHGRSRQLDELVGSGFVTYVEEERHPHQVKHLDLTKDGWEIYSFIERLGAEPRPSEQPKRVWSDAEQMYIEVD